LMHRFIVVLVVAVGTLFPAATAGAHAQLIDSTPKEGAKLDAVPDTIRLEFSEPPISGDDLVVEDGCGNDVVARAEADQAKKEIVATLSGGQPGDWKVSSRVVSTVDGHPTKDGFGFTVSGEADCTATDDRAPRERDEGSSSLPLLLGLGGLTVLVILGAFFVRRRS
jgi:methionine-rich copper-binding protein CopC